MERDDRAKARTGALLLILFAVMLCIWWGFAFYPTDAADDSWIAAAQAACFGSLPGGVPAPYAWMLLVLAPMLLLATMWVGFQSEIRAGFGLISRNPGLRVVALALVITFVGELAWAMVRVDRAHRINSLSFQPELSEALPADYPRLDRTLPAFSLVDQNGETFGSEELKGRATVMSFVFAHCQTVCPVLVETAVTAMRDVEPQRAGLTLITLDPWRDTPAALPSIAKRWNLPENAHLLSGEPEEVEALLDSLELGRQRDLQNGDIVHPPLVAIIDEEGKIAYFFNNPPPEWIVEAMRRVLPDA